MGTPNLTRSRWKFEINGVVSDRSTSRFGIREVTSGLNATGGRAFHINGRNILLRGWRLVARMMLRETSQRLRDELRYVRDMDLTLSA